MEYHWSQNAERAPEPFERPLDLSVPAPSEEEPKVQPPNSHFAPTFFADGGELLLTRVHLSPWIRCADSAPHRNRRDCLWVRPALNGAGAKS